MKTRPDLAALVLCALVVVCVTVLAALHVSVPEILPTLGLVIAGIGGGAALPTRTVSEPATPVIPAQAAAPGLERAPVVAP